MFFIGPLIFFVEFAVRYVLPFLVAITVEYFSICLLTGYYVCMGMLFISVY